MIKCPAIKLKNNEIRTGVNHQSIINMLYYNDRYDLFEDKEKNYGFIDDKNKFYNRQEAMVEAKLCKQVPETEVNGWLYSYMLKY